MHRELTWSRAVAVALLVAIAATTTARADEHLDAMGVVFGLGQPDPVDWWVDAGPDAKSGEVVDVTRTRVSMILTLDPEDRCKVNIAQTTRADRVVILETRDVDLRRASRVRFFADIGMVDDTSPDDENTIKAVIEGEDMNCVRTLIPGIDRTAATRSCYAEYELNWKGERPRKHMLAALRTIHKTCPLPGVEPSSAQ